MTPAALKKAGKFAYKFPEDWELIGHFQQIL
jgi:hypothetical protein